MNGSALQHLPVLLHALHRWLPSHVSRLSAMKAGPEPPFQAGAVCWLSLCNVERRATLASPDDSADGEMPTPTGCLGQLSVRPPLMHHALSSLMTCLTWTGPHRLDLGDILYAPNTLRAPGGRTLLLAWLQELRRGGGFDYAGCLSLHREITLQGAPGGSELRPIQSPQTSSLHEETGKISHQAVPALPWAEGASATRGIGVVAVLAVASTGVNVQEAGSISSPHRSWSSSEESPKPTCPVCPSRPAGARPSPRSWGLPWMSASVCGRGSPPELACS